MDCSSTEFEGKWDRDTKCTVPRGKEHQEA